VYLSNPGKILNLKQEVLGICGNKVLNFLKLNNLKS
jgi:hypothetical protein